MESKEIGYCKICGKPFKKTTPNKVFCSIDCRKLYPYIPPKEKVKKICPKCGKEFFAQSNHKFCSFKCKLQFNEKKLRERKFVKCNILKIREILGKKCEECGGIANEIHHKTYDIPIRKINYDKRKKYKNVTEEDFNRMLLRYCEYLSHFCSNCHKKIHKLS